MMNLRSTILLIVLSILTNNVKAQAWTTPFFSEPEARSGLTYIGYVQSQLRITMEEEMSLNITIAVIEYTGSETPVLGEFYLNNNVLLGAEITQQTDGKWAIVVTRRQDYENVQTRQGYLFDVVVGTVSNRVVLLIENINDNLHVMSPIDSCVVDELKGDFVTNCFYKMEDADGFMGLLTHIFEINGNFNDSDHFDFNFYQSNDTYTREYVLKIKKALDYDVRTIHTFITLSFDQDDNSSSMNTIVQVNDMPNMDPRWIRPFPAAQIQEKQDYVFEILAIDGDTGINKPICYELQFEEGKNYSNYLSVGTEDGIINVNKIDRDAEKNEFYSFIIYAYKCYNYTWGIYANASIIVDDVNDNYPEITLDPTTISINESEFVKLPFDTFMINDIDLGPHATFDVVLTEEQNALEVYSSAFNIIPNSGYQLTPFSINVLNAELLDYEEANWQNFTITIIATELDVTHWRRQSFIIQLINRNDEIPVFDADEYDVSILEMSGADVLIGKVHADDRDIDDNLIYSLVGSINTTLRIDPDTGELFTRDDNVFDYQQQTEVVLQVRVDDTLQTYEGEKTHTVYTQFTINVIDENDKTPELRLPRSIPHISENSLAETIVTSEIIGSDPDTTADIYFSINWEDSYVSKSGQEAEKKFYEECFYIEHVRDPTNNNRVVGNLRVNPNFTENYNIDYEEYEIMYLTIIVTDRNQEYNSATSEAILIVRIDDENDNMPEFSENTLTAERNVLEEAVLSTLIGTIYAYDLDGPGNNIITYTIESHEDTPSDLVAIDPSTGVISVKLDKAIDCDVPPREFLNYTIHLTDGFWNNSGNISISIIDTNNKNPQIELTEFETTIRMYENATEEDYVGKVIASDLDRDAPHNVLEYTFNYQLNPNLQRFFTIDAMTGELVLGPTQLNRDEGLATHDIYINVQDNYQGNGARLRNETMIQLIVLDVNNKEPELPSADSLNFSANENDLIDHIIHKDFYAPDKDDFETPNAWVSYEILSVVSNDSAEETRTLDGLIAIVSNYPDKKKMQYGDIVIKQSLKGYYGDWNINIRAYDHGDEWDSRVSLSKNQTYLFRIDPYNYETPVITYPVASNVIRLRLSEQNIGQPLVKINGDQLDLFEAVDTDGGSFGDVTFEILSDSENGQYFRLSKWTSRHQSELSIIQILPPNSYSINIRASDGGGKSQTINNLKIIFVDMEGQPYFTDTTFTASFNETDLGLTESAIIPEATDPKNAGISDDEEPYAIYYFIDPTYRAADAAFFKLDKVTRELTLAKELDRETVDNHEIRIISTNDETYNSQNTITANSLLLIQITVIDVNDNPPEFEIKEQGIGITTSDYISKVLVTLVAIDPDLDDVITYSIATNSITAVGDGIEAIKDTAFTLDAVTGELKLNFIPQASQKGYFKIPVIATDLVGHEGYCEVTIFIVADSNRVAFLFVNSLDELELNRQFVKETFSQEYEMECFVDDIKPYDIDGINQDDISEFRVHFVKDNVAVEAIEIHQRTNDILFVTRLKQLLSSRALILQDIPNDSLQGESSSSDTTQIVLIVICCVLGALCVVLALAFFIRNKNLQRELNAMTTTDFGSTVSNLKRRDAPTTNIFSIEGSNPIINSHDMNKSQFEDNLSIQSYESDLNGLDNNPIFQNRKESLNPKLIEEIKRKSLNPLTHGAANNKEKTDDNDYI